MTRVLCRFYFFDTDVTIYEPMILLTTGEAKLEKYKEKPASTLRVPAWRSRVAPWFDCAHHKRKNRPYEFTN